MTSNMQIDICGQLPCFRQRWQTDRKPIYEEVKRVGIQQQKQADSNEDIAERFSKDELVSILEKYLL